MSDTTDPVSVLWLKPAKPDNISVHAHRIKDHLTAAGHDVTVRGTTAGSVARSLGERGRYDVVIGTTRLGAIAGVLVSAVHGVPLVVEHIDPIRQFRETNSRAQAAVVERLENVAFRRAAHVLYVYAEEAGRVIKRARAASKTDLGVDVDRFADPDPEVIDRASERLGDTTGNVAVYLGGLEPYYSIEALLASVDHLEDWTLVFLGAGSLEATVSAAADTSDSVEFLGTVPHDDIPGYLHVADVGVAMVDDPHTLKVLEYGAARLPVVQQAGHAESRFGGLVSYCDPTPDAIAAAIERANRTDGSALAQYVSQFDWERIADHYCQVITTVKYRHKKR